MMRRLRGLPKTKKNPPYAFVTEALSGTDLRMRAMFGCTAVYVGEKITFVLCDREAMREDIGVWVCIPDEFTKPMKEAYPDLRGVSFFENENSAWQCLPASNPRFEELALHFCAMARRGDPRIGRIPKTKQTKRHAARSLAKRRES